MNTNLDLQLWLAKQLPEAIVISDRGFFWSDHVPRSDEKVTVNEWPYIVGLVEGKLNDYEYGVYERDLDDLVSPEGLGRLTSASWHQRATALKKVMGEEYERA